MVLGDLGGFLACFYDGSKYSYLYSDGINQGRGEKINDIRKTENSC